MAKKSKTNPATETGSSASSGADSPAAEAAAPQKKKRPTAGRKATAKRPTGKSGGRKSGSKSGAKRAKTAAPPEPSDADIRLRAYFIAERRVQLALQGDPSRDWLEAKQQLVEEARQARS